MSAASPEQPLPTGVLRWTIIGTLLVGAFVFSLNARGYVLQSQVVIQAFGLDRYKIQWVTGLEGVACADLAVLEHLPDEGVRSASGVPAWGRIVSPWARWANR